MADQGRYIAVAHTTSPYFTLLNHTTPEGTKTEGQTWVLTLEITLS